MCKCQACGKDYKIDIITPDSIWEIIKPDGKATGAGLLCGQCILNRIDKLGGYEVYTLELEYTRLRAAAEIAFYNMCDLSKCVSEPLLSEAINALSSELHKKES